MLTQITRPRPELIPLYRIAQTPTFDIRLHDMSLTFSDPDDTEFLDGETIDYILEQYANRQALTYTEDPALELLDNLGRFWSLKCAQYTAAYLAYSEDYDPLHNYDMHETGSETGSRENTGTQTIKDTGTQTTAGNNSRSNTGTQTTNDTGTQTVADTGTQTTANTGTVTDAGTSSNTTTNTVSAFDSATYSPHDQTESSGTTGNTRTDNTQSQRTDALQSQRTDALQSQRTDNLSETGSHSETRTDNLQHEREDDFSEESNGSHNLYRYGNIGVTSSQQLLEAELALRLRHSLQERFIFEFVSAFTV